MRARLRIAACITGLLMLALMLVIHLTPLTQVWARMLAGDWTDANGDTLIVLSAALESDGVLGQTSYLRTLYALRAQRDHAFSNIIVTGGGPPGGKYTLGGAMREFLVTNGVPAAIVHAETHATSTRENALFSRPMLGPHPGIIVLMTSDYHMFRARRTFETAGIPVVPRPIPDVLKHSNHILYRWTDFWKLTIETGKIAYYAWKGWI